MPARRSRLSRPRFPDVTASGVIDRALLGKRVVGDKAALAKLEAIVHPLVHAAENAFRARAAGEGRRVAVLDIPLLLETGGEARVDAVVVVTTTAEEQRARILRRDGMTEERAAALLARQMPDAEKRKRAHFIIELGANMPRPGSRSLTSCARSPGLRRGRSYFCLALRAA